MRNLSLFVSGVLFVSCLPIRQDTALTEALVMGKKIARAIEKSCQSGQPVIVPGAYFKSTAVSGTGLMNQKKIWIEKSSSVLISMQAGGGQYDCGIMWTPCAIQVSPVMLHGPGSFQIQARPDDGSKLSEAMHINVGGPPGRASIERINCVRI